MSLEDPTLASSVKRAEMDNSNVKSVMFYIILFVAIVFLVWLLFSLIDGQLDTRTEDIIDVNPNLVR